MKDGLEFRMMAYSDFQAFQEACLESKEELTTYLDLGRYMENFIFTDYWSLFTHLLKEPEMNLYGLFDARKLLGSAAVMPASRSFGAQIVGWVRHGYHSQGLATLYLPKLIERCFENGHHFVEFVIDQENAPSRKVAEKLGLVKISEWENFESGQGLRNSGKFVLYYGFDSHIQQIANDASRNPQEIHDQLWVLEALGIVQTPVLVERPPQFGNTRISQTIRFLNTEKRLSKTGEDSPFQDTTPK